MAFELRGDSGKRYAYRSVRRGSRVTKLYLGAQHDHMGNLLGRLDRWCVAERRARRDAERADQDPAFEDFPEAYFRRVRSLTRALSSTPETTMPKLGRDPQKPARSAGRTAPDELPTVGEYHALLARADRGSEQARRELAALYDTHPELWRAVGDLGRQVQAYLVGQAPGESFHLQEGVSAPSPPIRTSRPRPAGHDVVALLSDQDVAPGGVRGVDSIVATPADEDGPVDLHQPVGSQSDQRRVGQGEVDVGGFDVQVRAGAAVEEVIAGATRERVVPPAAA